MISHRDMADGAGDREAVEIAVAELEANPSVLEAAILELWSQNWDDEAERQRIENAIEAARSKLPVVELGIIAAVVMYGMFLNRTKGIKESKTITRRGADGSHEEITTTTYQSPVGALSAVTNVISKFVGG